MHAITRYNGTLYPVAVSITTYEAIERLPEGKGYFYADAAYNTVVDRGYIPIKPRKNKARGYGAKIRNKIFDEERYRRRGICEGFFGALTNWFGDEIPLFGGNCCNKATYQSCMLRSENFVES